MRHYAGFSQIGSQFWKCIVFMCPNEAYNTLLFMQIAILLHDLQLHLIIINVYTGTILKLYITY